MFLRIRPEHISVEPIDGQSQNEISATVDLVQPMGERIEVYLTSRSNQKFVTSIKPHSKINVNSTVKIYFNVNHAHIFELGMTDKNVSLICMVFGNSCHRFVNTDVGSFEL